MFNRTERLYLLYAETQGFISPEQASSAEDALRQVRLQGNMLTPWDLLREWKYLSPEQTDALYGAVYRAADKCEHHPMVVAGSPTAETTLQHAISAADTAVPGLRVNTPAVPALPQLPTTMGAEESEPPADYRLSVEVPRLTPESQSHFADYVVSDTNHQSDDNDAELVDQTGEVRAELPAVGSSMSTPVVPSLMPIDASPTPAAPTKVEPTAADTNEVMAVGSGPQKVRSKSPTTKIVSKPGTKALKAQKLETTSVRRSRTRQLQAQKKRSVLPISLAATIVLGGAGFYAYQSIPPPASIDQESSTASNHSQSSVEENASILLKATEADSASGNTSLDEARADTIPMVAEASVLPENQKQKTGPVQKPQVVTTATVHKQVDTKKQEKPKAAAVEKKRPVPAVKTASSTVLARASTSQTDKSEPEKLTSEMRKELEALEDFFGDDEVIWIGNEPVKGTHDGDEKVFNIYKGSPISEDGRLKTVRIYSDIRNRRTCSVFLLRMIGSKLTAVKKDEFGVEWKKGLIDHVLNWKVKKGDLLAHWGPAPAMKEADTSDECYVLSAEPKKGEVVNLADATKLPRRVYSLQVKFTVTTAENDTSKK